MIISQVVTEMYLTIHLDNRILAIHYCDMPVALQHLNISIDNPVNSFTVTKGWVTTEVKFSGEGIKVHDCRNKLVRIPSNKKIGLPASLFLKRSLPEGALTPVIQRVVFMQGPSYKDADVYGTNALSNDCSCRQRSRTHVRGRLRERTYSL